MKAKLLLLLCVPAAAAAGGQMKPGQYEYNVKMEMPGMPFPLPPQTFQHCLTQADIDKGKQYEQDKCQIKNMKESAGKASFEIACEDGTTGKADYAFTDTGMTGKTIMSKDGQPMTMNLAAKRIGECK